ncbi:ComF family protein [Tropicimonas sp. IMCC6043]|nr:ComF family protein [Tropicimonas sp. IMCC6043]RYH11008.1 ComF family protein [Tropicimonas sp. IMCC6043]
MRSAVLQSGVQAVMRLVYPPHCLTCNAIVGTDHGLCPDCWSRTPFLAGLRCDLCGAPLLGDDPTEIVHCDDCRVSARLWTRGRAVLAYRDNARTLVLALKHGDRTDLAEPAGRWMARVAQDIRLPGQIVAPAPLHWRRLFRRRYNQAGLLGSVVARELGLEHCPDLLVRHRFTGTQEGKGVDARFANVAGAIRVPPRHHARIADRPVLLVDDVLTSGATLAACAEACYSAGAGDVRVLALARVVKDR